ncbi:MAG TPA: SDR family NAD(P)-dependent oxidoreductase, partial [bacterium]|nr:SDR family NAD(P)-dependent oxidoreductase [bacterium]
MRETRALADMVAVVTGGGRGIGAAVALAFAQEGARLVLAARTAPELDRIADQVRSLGGTALVAPGDVSEPGDVARIFDAAAKEFGRLDVLVNAAGVLGPIGSLWDVAAEEWLRTIHVNLYGTFLCCRAALPRMIAQRRGKVINFSGGGATSPFPQFTAYGSSKAAVVRLTETLAEEVSPFNIQVNAIAPGMVDTSIHDEVLAAGERAGAHLVRVLAMREQGEGRVSADLPARLAVFLASDQSGGLSGK